METRWIHDLANEVCWDRGRRPPLITVKTRRDRYSSGTYWRGDLRATIRVGSDEAHAKIVVLHEVAHHLARTQGHSVRFWRTAWRLYHDYGADLNVAHATEGSYMKKALPVLHGMLDRGELPDWEPCC